MSVDLDYTLDQLRTFVERHDQPPVLAFYGGEPLIRWERMKEIIDEFSSSKFMLQTNGTLIHRITKDYVNRFSTILLSIDGRQETTDRFRGVGVYDMVISAKSYLRSLGYTGEIVARMTVSVGSEIYEEVVHLIDQGFDTVHWQLNAMWDIPEGNEVDEFEEWRDRKYNPGITKLVNWWVQELQRGRFHNIAPLSGIAHTVIAGEKVGLRCGAGKDFFAVTTDGRVTACPIPPSLVFPILGNIFESQPDELPDQIEINNPCKSCQYLDICGGRCLYTNLTKHWGNKGFDAVCVATKHLIDEIKRVSERIQDLIGDGSMTLESLKYPKIPNGVEIIP